MKQIAQLRADTPGAENVKHFNNCGAALMPRQVLDAQVEHLKLESKIGAYEAALMAKGKRTSYVTASKLLGCEPDEIAFCDSASRAWDAFAYSLRFDKGDEILTSRVEFGANLVSLGHIAKRDGARIRITKSRADGTVDIDDFRKQLSDKTKLVALTHAAAHYGGINPVEAVGEIVAGTGAMYLVDACQSFGQMPVDVSAIQCDALTITGRKWLRGPRGTGLLFVRSTTTQDIDPVLSDVATGDVELDEQGEIVDVKLRSDARRFELWERSVAAEIGLGAALQYLLDLGVENVHAAVKERVGRIADKLSNLDGLKIIDPASESGVIGLRSADGRPIPEIQQALRSRGINTSTMADYDAPLDFSYRGIETVLRISPHYYNTFDEVDDLCEALIDVTRR
ncbi:aminotransferase class V-fold PLP-dependent enzyme [Micromonospora arida]|uniref:aminotransferase class V-fold PLP-dependent enzyme n=1 Tax=Micromonospora arida TaxID=2203715 RepID=UPI0033E5A888